VPVEWNIKEVDDPYSEDGLRFAHIPCEDSSVPSFCGHVHPVFALRDYDRTTVRAPCFVLEPSSLMLPAFGTFTGGEAVQVAQGRRIYIVTERRVVAVSGTG
jgi:metallophosphoesterase superfamily enzyme